MGKQKTFKYTYMYCRLYNYNTIMYDIKILLRAWFSSTKLY